MGRKNLFPGANAKVGGKGLLYTQALRRCKRANNRGCANFAEEIMGVIHKFTPVIIIDLYINKMYNY
jgi:hypothetical protein